MTEPSVEVRPPSAGHEHPPFRLRERRRVLLPDLRPPTLDELRWAARQRRLRRGTEIPEPRRPRHGPPDGGENAAVTTTVQEPHVIELPEVIEPAALVEPEAVRAPEVIEPPEVVEPAGADLPPLVSQVLVVREPAPPEPGRVAVLDEHPGDVATITRLVPVAPEAAPVAEPFVVDPDWVEEAAPDVPSQVDGRPAPLYWRLLRLRYTRPNGWLRALFFEGAVAIAVVLVLAEAASVWTIVVLPFVVAVVVKANDVLAGSLTRSYRRGRRR